MQNKITINGKRRGNASGLMGSHTYAYLENPLIGGVRNSNVSRGSEVNFASFKLHCQNHLIVTSLQGRSLRVTGRIDLEQRFKYLCSS